MQLKLLEHQQFRLEQGKQYIFLRGDIPCEILNNSFISIDRTPPLKIYSIGFQPAKSIPEIPRWFLNKYCMKDHVILEPFAGSGTTIIESLGFGSKVLWLDYNPLSQLICNVKTSYVSIDKLIKELQNIWKKATKTKNASSTIDFSNKDFWFQRSVQEALEILRENILCISSIPIQRALLLAFASTVRKVSNMNEGMILAAKRSHIQAIPKYTRDDVYNYFQSYTLKIAGALKEWHTVIRDKFSNAKQISFNDAKSLKGNWKCDAIVTSPPYINAIDYIWASKFELHWLGLVQNNEERLNLYQKEIGTERISKSECNELGVTENKILDLLIEDIYYGKKYLASNGQNKLRARVVYKYFLDMKEHFKSAFLHLKPGGYYCFTVGDSSKICGVDIPVASLLSEFASSIGFHEVFKFHILLKNRRLNIPRNVNWAGTIKHDSTIVLKKPDRWKIKI